MKKPSLVLSVGALAAAALLPLASAQPFQWPENYAPTAVQGGTIQETLFGDFLTFNTVLSSSAQETAVIGLTDAPSLVYRDWLGTRSFRDEEGNFNLFFAADIEEVRTEQEFVITLREGWTWSDGEEITAEDFMAARTIIGDPDVQSNTYSFTVQGEAQEPVIYEQLGEYQFRVTFPEPQVNAIGRIAGIGAVPAHIFMPVYEAEGAEGIRALWSIDTPVTELVSGGPYMITEFSPGERITLTRNEAYAQNVLAADGTPLPGPDSWTVTFVEDRNAQLALVTTDQTSFYWPTTLDEVRAVQQAVQNGTIGGQLFANVGPDSLVDFMTFNFNKRDECKRNLFRATEFRQAVAIMIDRDALVQAALGGLGFPAKDYQSEAAAPFDAPNLEPFEFDPERGRELLASIGFTEEGPDGVLRNPETGCRAEFDLQFNSGNNRRAQIAQVISQTLEPFGVRVNPREVASEIWTDSIVGTDYDPEVGRTVDYDAQIWGLAGGDVDNPSSVNVLGLGENLNAWNKDRGDAELWEISMDRLSRRMDRTLDLDERVEIYNQRAEIMREHLPIIPLISPAFHFHHDMGNVWPEEALDANSIESPYTPGNFRTNVTEPQ
jgi:peptide/nickel transport system substrate-binding protein